MNTETWALCAPHSVNIFGQLIKYEKVEVRIYVQKECPHERRVVIPLDNDNTVILSLGDISTNFTVTFARGSAKRLAAKWKGFSEDTSPSWQTCDKIVRKLKVFLRQEPRMVGLLSVLSEASVSRI